jgi:hypoxanthine phosphoribosyltransferase
LRLDPPDEQPVNSGQSLSPNGGTEPFAGRGTRIFEHSRIWRLDQDGFEAAARMLAVAEPPPALVVGIARGGVELAGFIGAWFGVPVATLTARHNVGDSPYAEMADVVEMAGAVPAASGGILIADDICGTGDTFFAAVSHVAGQLGPVAIRTMALCRNSGAAFTPDAWAWDVADWVSFPWEEPPSGLTELLPVPERLCLKEAQ